MVSGIMSKVAELQAETERQGREQARATRMLEDIYVFCKWNTSRVPLADCTSSPRLEYSGFAASHSYGKQSVQNLLDAPNSVL